MARVYNFSAGPAVLPQAVLKKAQAELLDFDGLGMSVMEMSHRSKRFVQIVEEAQANLRKLMNIPDDYHVLFLQGGASTQFLMVPMNLFSSKAKADYIDTGRWADSAIKEAQRLGTVNVVASSKDKTYSYLPEITPDLFDPEADFVHLTTNNTIYGTCFQQIPDTGKATLVGDMSSNILSQEYDVSRFGLIYAGAQKNIGPAGVTIVIVHKDLVGSPQSDNTPTMLNYETHVKKNSMFNTPPCFPIYMAGLVFEWILEQGGVKAMEEINRAKAALLYDFLDNSKLFKAVVAPAHRSLMNVPFVTNSDELNQQFLKEADAKGLKTLKGHRTVGGMRASIYNPMPVEGVQALVDFMKEFESRNA